MKKDIHPKYVEVKVTCSCGNSFVTRSTAGKELRSEICSNCHPFYTGKQKAVDTLGRVGRFQERYAKKPTPVVDTPKADKPATGKKTAAEKASPKAKADKPAAAKKPVKKAADK